MSSPRHTKFYEQLEVSPTASETEIKKSYRKLAMKYHPDRVSAAEKETAEAKFKEITRAYEILSDPEKRRMYDQYGEDGLNGAGMETHDAQSIFEQLFGFGGGRRQARDQGPAKTDDVNHKVTLTLAQFYTGVTKKLKVTRQVLCETCSGRGSENPSANTTCTTCRGQGIRIITQRIGPGMVQQMQTTCNECKGSGQIIDEKDKCKTCKGKKTKPETKILEVNVRPGMMPGSKITFYNDADEEYGKETGDIVITLYPADEEAKEEPRFPETSVPKSKEPQLPYQPHFKRLRNGHDLTATLNITLAEALTGFHIPLRHLDDHVFVVDSPENFVIQHSQYLIVEGEGMPNANNPAIHGDLILQIDIQMPSADWIKKLGPKGIEKLREVLPPLPSSHILPDDIQKLALKRKRKDEKAEDGMEEDAYVVRRSAKEYSQAAHAEKERQRQEEARTESYEDDDGSAGGAGPGCRQM